MSLAVRFQGIEKQFGPVRVLHGVTFDIAPGRIYGLLGENGAGKSTLMKILAGYERANAGELYIDERQRDFASSRDAEHAGIVLIHQELNLADHLSITQNMFLGHELKKGFFLDEPAMREAARARLSDVGLHKNPDTKVRDLIVAEKQLVEIAKAMLRDARLLIMDEPTATLTPSETQRLFGLMARLKDAGTTIVYISHKLDEVERVTDEVIVMRDGRFVARAPTARAHASADGESDGRPRSLRHVSRQAAARRRCAGRVRGRRRVGAGLGGRHELFGARRAKCSASRGSSARDARNCSRRSSACGR